MYTLLLMLALSSPITVNHTYSVADDIYVRIGVDIKGGYSVALPSWEGDCIASTSIYIDGRKLAPEAMLIRGYMRSYSRDCPVPLYQRQLSIEFKFMSPRRYTHIKVEIQPYLNGTKTKKITYKFRIDGKSGKTEGIP